MMQMHHFGPVQWTHRVFWFMWPVVRAGDRLVEVCVDQLPRKEHAITVVVATVAQLRCTGVAVVASRLEVAGVTPPVGVRVGVPVEHVVDTVTRPCRRKARIGVADVSHAFVVAVRLSVVVVQGAVVVEVTVAIAVPVIAKRDLAAVAERFEVNDGTRCTVLVVVDPFADVLVDVEPHQLSGAQTIVEAGLG